MNGRGLQPDWLPHWLSWLLEWAHQEQSLIAGILAFFAAAVTACFLYLQIKQQKERWKREEKRRELAVRARLPFALSEIVDFCSEGYVRSRHAYLQFENTATAFQPIDVPTLPSRAIVLLGSLVEISSIDSIRDAAQQVLKELQVVHSRLSASFRSYRGAGVGGINSKDAYADRAADCEYLRILTERLFEYSRGEREKPTPFQGIADAERVFFFAREKDEFSDRVWTTLSLSLDMNPDA